MSAKVRETSKTASSQPAPGGSPPGAEKPAPPEKEARRSILVPSSLTVSDLANRLGASPVGVIKILMRNGIMAGINQVINYEAAALVAKELGIEVKVAAKPSPTAPGQTALKYVRFKEEDTKGQKLRPPVVTIMGHVDHGKTSLLDAIRQTNVVATEAGAITQHIGAYQVEAQGQKITFLDTPGHEAFTAMRARGARVTDIAILVVAADDGVMPQTIEAINHAKAAGVPIVVALNKMDKPNANPDRVKQQLADQSLILEEWGGDVICVPVSAKKKEGISDLLENVLLVAELAELKANPNRPAAGTVIEARLDNTRGPLATLLVQTGTLKVSDVLVAGKTYGKVKAMFNNWGQPLKRAEPSAPVEVLGLNSVPQAGDTFKVVADERAARAQVEGKQAKAETVVKGGRPLTLDDVYDQIKTGQVKALNLILKTDVQGSIEPIRGSLERLSTEEVKVYFVHAGTGNITESDVMLALASKAIILGFNAQPEPGARHMAEAEGVDIHIYSVIYELVDSVQKALQGMLEPKYTEAIEGHAQVKAVFSVGKRGKVAGVHVTDGKVSRNAQVRVIRAGQTVADSKVNSLKHFKEDVAEMAAGFECGVGVENFVDFQEGDILEFYRTQRAN